jgi:hypothetical protein
VQKDTFPTRPTASNYLAFLITKEDSFNICLYLLCGQTRFDSRFFTGWGDLLRKRMIDGSSIANGQISNPKTSIRSPKR